MRKLLRSGSLFMNNEQWHISLGLFLCAGVVAVFAAANAILKLKAETTLVEFHDLTIASASDYYDKCQRFNESCHFDEDYKQLQEKFLYKNTPISPEIIKKFMSNQSYDYKNNIVSIDVASCWKTNRFSRKKYDYILLENNQFQCGLVRHAGQEDLGIYKWIGRLDNGLHVVRFVEDPEDYNYGGYLLFFKISQAEALHQMAIHISECF